MNLEILEIKEYENGGAELLIEMDEEMKRYLLNKALIAIIKEGLIEIKQLHEEQENADEDKSEG